MHQDVYLVGKFARWIGRGGLQDRNPSWSQSETLNPSLPFWKRALDISAIVLSLPATLAVALPLALYIKWVSPGPVLFRQERVGHRCRTFRLFKFRSMHCGADTAVHDKHLKQLIGSEVPMQKMDGNDNRLIPLGKWIRASGVDELPQLLNVLRGEMSLVGPRPCTTFEFEHYESWQKERFNAVPGLTGLWQVCGKNRTTFRQMVQMDIAYARHKCLALDLSIMVRTFPALLVQVLAARKSVQMAKSAVKSEVSSTQSNKEVGSATAHPASKTHIKENEESAEDRGSRVRVLGA